MKRTFEVPPSQAESSPPSTPTPSPRELPKWFELRSFQYDGRVFVVSLPGLCLALALSGELLLGVVVTGGLIIHFMQSGGARRRAVLAFLFVFIAAQVSTIYSALPLVWESIYHIITILLLNMSVVLTGGWVLLHFEEFLKEEPSLAEIIELSLFTIFPTVSVAVFTCILAMVTWSHYIPYSVIIHGFLVLRLFVTPSPPSFRKRNMGSYSDVFVLGHAEVSLLLILYISAPVEIFIILNVWDLLSLITILELLLLFTLPCFLMTLLEIRTWSDRYGIPHRYIVWSRWAFGLASLFFGWILLSQTQDSLLVHWLSVTILGNVLLGWTATQKGQIGHMFKMLCSLAVLCIYVLAVHYSIPWHLTLPSVNLSIVGFGLTMNALLSVACFLACSAGNRRLCTTLLIAFMAGMVYNELYLSEQKMYSILLMSCTSVISTYLLVRLLSAGIIFWYGVWVGSAVHASKLPFFIGLLTGRPADTSRFVGVPVVAFTLAVTKLLFFEYQKEISNNSALCYVVSVLASLLLCFHSLIEPLSYMLFDNSLTVVQTVCFIVALTGTVCLKLSVQHLHHVAIAHRVNLLCLAASGLAFILQPSSALDWHAFSRWLTLLAGTLVAAAILGIVSANQSLFAVFFQSVIVGLASGAEASDVLFAMPSKLTLLQYTLSCTPCAFILLSLWANFTAKRAVRKQPLLKPVVFFLAIVASVTYITELSQKAGANFSLLEDFRTPCLRLYCATSLLLSFALRLYCFLIQSTDPFGFSPNKVSTISNVFTILAYLLACLNCPLQPWEIWNSGCALLLLNLQQDPEILTSLAPKRRTGIVLGACLFGIYSSTVLHSDLLVTGISLLAFFEALLLLATLPVFVTFVQHQVISDHVLNVELVVFLTPLNALFFLVGSSFTSWLLSCVGLSAGIWMLVEKISIKDL
ncbi:uncharacterized protein LOC110985436 isoform X2 [Acanthaster planci]|nr:uncharacterized protein LOC110985436 isoform X2 [Acanthaster planci]